MKKDDKNKQKKYYHNLFWELYDCECMQLGTRWIERIETGKHYSHLTMKKTCIVLKWFNDNFNKNECYLCLAASGNSSFRAFVYDKFSDKLIKFVCFERKNKCYIPTFGVKDGEYKNVDQCDYIEERTCKK